MPDSNIIQIDQNLFETKLDRLVTEKMTQILNAMLDAEADEITGAARYERKEGRKAYRAGHYERTLTAKAGRLELRVPKLKGAVFESAVIERYRRREESVEEALIDMYLAGVSTRQVDDMAKKTGCTICGSGYQDVFWGNLIATLAGAMHTIKRIKGSSSYNVEDYGIALAKAHGAGLDLPAFEREIAAADAISPAERQQLIEKGEFLPSYMWNVNGWLAARLGLTVTGQTQKCVPMTYSTELKSSTLGMTIPAGYATGMSAVVTTETQEGITIESECIGKVYAPDEVDRNDWTLMGEPDTQVVITQPATVELTCATIVNRIPDIINAAPGYVTTDLMPVNSYRVKPLDHYVNK